MRVQCRCRGGYWVLFRDEVVMLAACFLSGPRDDVGAAWVSSWGGFREGHALDIDTGAFRFFILWIGYCDYYWDR